MSTKKSNSSPGDYVFMAFLSSGPKSAYDIKKQMEGAVSFFWSAAQSQVYQQAARLLRDGFIKERGGVGIRGKRLFVLTSKGQRALKSWMSSPSPVYRVFDESLVKLYFGKGIPKTPLVDIFEDQLVQHLRLLSEFEQFRSALENYDPGDSLPHELMTLELGIRIEQTWVEWLEQTIAKLKS